MVRSDTQNMALIGVFTALALALHLVENLFLVGWGPPGAKLGLANVVALLLLLTEGWRPALVVTLLRILLASFFGGNFLAMAFWMSLAGGTGSTILMALLLQVNREIDPRLLGVAGAITHNLCQLATAYIFIGRGILYYLPILILFAVPAGAFTGTIAHKLQAPMGYLINRGEAHDH